MVRTHWNRGEEERERREESLGLSERERQKERKRVFFVKYVYSFKTIYSTNNDTQRITHKTCED